MRRNSFSRRERKAWVRATGLWKIMIVMIVPLCALIMVGVVFFSPWLSVRSIKVTGNTTVDTQKIIQASAIAPGTAMVSVNAQKTATNIVQSFVQIRQVHVIKKYPSSLQIHVTERVGVALVQKKYLIDAYGVIFRTTTNTHYPTLEVTSPGPSDAATLAALHALRLLPENLQQRVTTISAVDPVTIMFSLRPNVTIIYGSDQRSAAKNVALGIIMREPGPVYNVIDPLMPVASRRIIPHKKPAPAPTPNATDTPATTAINTNKPG